MYSSNLKAAVKLSFSQILFQCNSCFVGANLLKLFFITVSELSARNLSEMRQKVSKIKRPEFQHPKFFASNVCLSVAMKRNKTLLIALKKEFLGVKND